jgi:glycine/D-amino acid oxidase-like deaminating enzyme
MISEWILFGGYFYETKDGLPYIGNIPIFQVLILFLGFGGNGITFSVIGMELVSEMLKTKNIL